MFCYLCQEQFKDNDLVLPLNLSIKLPYGLFALTIFTHYLCGLNHVLGNIAVAEIRDKDRIEIEARLMETLTSIGKGTTQ